MWPVKRNSVVKVYLLVAGMLLVGATAPEQSDLAAPVLVNLTVSPPVVDTSEAAQVLTFEAHVTDDLSGFALLEMDWRPDVGGTQRRRVWFDEDDLISGTLTDGVYRSTMELPRYSAHGRWSLELVALHDVVGNSEVVIEGQNGWHARYDDYHFVNASAPSTTTLYLPLVLGGAVD